MVPAPEDVGLHGHSPPRRRARVLGVVAETRLEVAAGDGGVKGRLWGTDGEKAEVL